MEYLREKLICIEFATSEKNEEKCNVILYHFNIIPQASCVDIKQEEIFSRFFNLYTEIKIWRVQCEACPRNYIKYLQVSDTFTAT